MSIESINIGLCMSRLQLGEPCYFVNWQQDGQNMYEFFSLRFACETFKNRLLKSVSQISEPQGGNG